MNTQTKLCLSLEERKAGLSAPFRRTTEVLDWKKIASIDVDKLIQTANVELLDELIGQIVYCRGEAEFDSQNSDSGFLKVFKLSQLIIEHLLYCQETLQEKYKTLDERCGELEKEKTEQVKEIQALKDTLAAAKKELRRRKELLANAQSEVIGDNKDEFDPCPYCSKKFLTTAYLLSHMQRRHQGLPLHPVFPAQTIFHGFASKIIENDYNTSVQSSPRRLMKPPLQNHAVTQETQTEFSPASTPVDPQTIAEIVEKCLKEKLEQEKPQKISELVHQVVQTESDELKNEGPKVTEKDKEETESMKKIINELKHQLDLQWQYLSGKVHESGIAELKALLAVEPGEISGPKDQNPVIPQVTKVTVKDAAVQEEGRLQIEHSQDQSPLHSPMKIHEEVEERLQKQQNELETLKTQLQSKVEHDLAALESKLESQERYWRSKLRSVEDEYASKLSKLRTDLQESIEKNRNITPAVTPSTQHAQVQVEHSSSSHTESSEYTDSLAASQPFAPSPENHITHHHAAQNTAAKAAPPQPVIAKISVQSPRVPRSQRAPQTPESRKPVAKPRATNAPPVRTQQQPTPAQRDRIIPAVRQAYEEPEYILEFDQVEEYSGSEGVSEYSSEDEEEHAEEYNRGRRTINIRMLTEEQEVRERMEAMKKQVTEEINNQLRMHGLEPEKQAATEEQAATAEKMLSLRRKSLEKEHPDFGKMRETIRGETKTALLDKVIQERLQVAALNTPEKGSRSPLVKIFGAVKSSGKKMRNKVKSAIKKTPKTPPTPMKASKGGFFSRARWRKRKSPSKTPPPTAPPPDQGEESSESLSESESETSDQNQVEVRYVPKPPQFSSTPLKGPLKEPEESSGEESASVIQSSSDHEAAKKKLKVRSNKAARLRYKESRKNSAAAAVRRASTKSPRAKQEVGKKKSPRTASSAKKPVRRSLQAEFDNVTPENKAAVMPPEESDDEDDPTDEEVASSWDEDGAEMVEKEQRGEYVKLTPSKYTLERIQDRSFTPEIEPVTTKNGKGDGRGGPNDGWHSPRSALAQRSTSLARPMTARPKIAMDSWDNEEDSEMDSVQVQRNSKPTLVSQRWNEQPIHSNVGGGKRIPMDVFTAKPAGNARPVTAAPKRTTHSRDSPLNNSWDSG